MNRQRWDADIRAQAKALYLADGAALASSVTQVPIRTVRQWAKDGNWRQPGPDDGHAADQRDTPDTGGPEQDAGPAKRDGAPFGSFSGPPGLELERDLALARMVYRAECERYQAGQGRPAGIRDAAVTLGILLDKTARHGLPGVQGGEWYWQANHERAQAAGPRIMEMAAALSTRKRAAGNGHG
jgi:hypothetical protein